MKLTTEQIATIEETLVLNGVVYDDIKLELLDHIASEIEATMAEKDISFETAYKQAFENWKEQLRPCTSYCWLRGNKTIPKIIILRCVKMIKHLFLLSTIMGLLISILVTLLIQSTNNEEILFALNTVIKVVSLSGIILFLFVKYKFWQSKNRTTYSYLFNQNGFNQIINLIFITIGVFQFKSNASLVDFHFISVFFPITMLFISGFYLTTVMSHFQFEKKLSMSNS
jgi:hypothetical protein